MSGNMTSAAAGFLRARLLARSGMVGLFSLRPHDATRHAGALATAAGLASPPHQARQVHGVRALACHGAGRRHTVDADILIGLEGTAVAVRTADCVPILLADPAANITVAIHAGWRGAANGAVLHGIHAACRHGAQAKRLLACIGPCIGPCCFEIGPEVAEALAQSAPDAGRFIRRAGDHIRADLAGINMMQLRQAGISPARIEHMNACTACDAQRFFSWRRDGEQAGRHLAVVACKAGLVACQP